EQSVKYWQSDHHAQPEHNGAYAARGSIDAFARSRRHRSSEKNKEQSVNDAEDQSENEHEQPVHLRYRQHAEAPDCHFSHRVLLFYSHVEQAEAWHTKLLSQTLQQKVIERLIIDSGFHLTAIRFELILDFLFQVIECFCINDREHRVVQHSFETGQRVFELASVGSCAAPKISFNRRE